MLIRHLRQLKTIVFLHWCLMRAVLLKHGSRGLIPYIYCAMLAVVLPNLDNVNEHSRGVETNK